MKVFANVAKTELPVASYKEYRNRSEVAVVAREEEEEVF